MIKHTIVHFADTYKELEAGIRKNFGKQKASLIVFKIDEKTCRLATYKRHKIRLSKPTPLEARSVTMNMRSLKQIILAVPEIKKEMSNVFWFAISTPKEVE